MCEFDYKYCEYNGLEFIIHHLGDELLFDVDYKGDLLLLDLGDDYEVVELNETLRDMLGLGDN